MDWQAFISAEQQKEYFKKLQLFLDEQQAAGKVIYPKQALRFKAFSLTEIKNTKVVILGQDPYHGEGQAHGLSFSVPNGIKLPPSLRNIFKELVDEQLLTQMPVQGDLSQWAEQGVLLLNAVLSVEQSKAGSHAKKGWETFTDNVIQHINQECSGVVFLLWGAYANSKSQLIDTNKHFILSSVHPSPLSAYRGFFGCKHFSKANQLLSQQGKEIINWSMGVL